MDRATLETPVGQLAAQRPEVLPVLEQLRVDYCCGGDQTIADACRQAQVDPQQLLAAVNHNSAPANVRADWQTRPLADLCDHIEQTHHAFLREQLPFLTNLIDKVVAAHASKHRELIELCATFRELRAELEPHMFKEERILFPAVRMMETMAHAPTFPFGTVQNPIDVMEHEHDAAGAALRRMRELSDNYHAPVDACNAFRVLYESLQRLEADLHVHIHKENNILFPRAAELECRLSQAV